MASDNTLYSKGFSAILIALSIIATTLIIIFGALFVRNKWLKFRNEGKKFKHHASKTIILNPNIESTEESSEEGRESIAESTEESNKEQTPISSIETIATNNPPRIDYKKLKEMNIINDDNIPVNDKDGLKSMPKRIRAIDNISKNIQGNPSLLFDNEISNINEMIELYSGQQTAFLSNNPHDHRNINSFLQNKIQNKEPFNSVVQINDIIKAIDNGVTTNEFKNKIDALKTNMLQIEFEFEDKTYDDIKNSTNFSSINKKLNSMKIGLFLAAIRYKYIEENETGAIEEDSETKIVEHQGKKYNIINSDGYGKTTKAMSLISDLQRQISGQNTGHYFRIHGNYDNETNNYNIFYEDTLSKLHSSFYARILSTRIIKPIKEQNQDILITQHLNINFDTNNLRQNKSYECGPFVLYNNNKKYFHEIGINHQDIAIENKKNTDGSDFYNNNGQIEQIYNKKDYDTFCKKIYLACYLLERQHVIHQQFKKIEEQILNQVVRNDKSIKVIKQLYEVISKDIIAINRYFVENDISENIEIYDTKIFQIYGDKFQEITRNFNGFRKTNEINSMLDKLNEINSAYALTTPATTTTLFNTTVAHERY
jgi:hypothetical protein